MGYWRKDGKIIVDKDTGKIINCGKCPCGPKCDGYKFKKIINTVTYHMILEYEEFEEDGELMIKVSGCHPDREGEESSPIPISFTFKSCHVSRIDGDDVYVTGVYTGRHPDAPDSSPDDFVEFVYRFRKDAPPGSDGVLFDVGLQDMSPGELCGLGGWCGIGVVWPQTEWFQQNEQYPEYCGYYGILGEIID